MNETNALTILFVIRIVVPFIVLMSLGEIARIRDHQRWQHRF